MFANSLKMKISSELKEVAKLFLKLGFTFEEDLYNIYNPAPARRAFEIMVATGAPAIPILNLKIKIGSNIAFIITLIELNIVGVIVFPCELIIELKLKYKKVKGISKKVILKKISL